MRYDDRVQLVLYPFALNRRSEIATQLALCAGEQGKFWQVHRMLYQRQGQWSHLPEPFEQLLTYSRELGLDTEALRSCVRSGRMAKLVDAAQDYGRSLQVRSTPTVFINDQRIIGAQSEADYVRTIRRELARARRNAEQ